MTTALEGSEGSVSRPGRSLLPEKTWYLLYRRLGGPQGWSGRVQKILPPTGIWSPDCPARSQSLYRVRYPAHLMNGGSLIFVHKFEHVLGIEWMFLYLSWLDWRKLPTCYKNCTLHSMHLIWLLLHQQLKIIEVRRCWSVVEITNDCVESKDVTGSKVPESLCCS
jgi:hypothetical protein